MLFAYETDVLSALESKMQVRYASREYSINNGIDENFEAEGSSYDHGISEKESFLPLYGHYLTEREVSRYFISFVSTKKRFFPFANRMKKRFGNFECTRWMRLFRWGKKLPEKSATFSTWIEYTFAIVVSFQ